jgi:hypothetical protein
MMTTTMKRLRSKGGVSFVSTLAAVVSAAVLTAGGLPAVGAEPGGTADPVKPGGAAGPADQAGPGNGRLDGGYPYPPLEPTVSEVPGIEIGDWGYRFTNPGSPENVTLIQAEIENVSEEDRSGLFVAGLEYGVPWVFPSPVWFRVDILPVELEPGGKETVTVEFPGLRSIHIGVKSEFYKPRVLVRNGEDYRDDTNAIEGVKILEWNYTMVSRPRGPRPAKFSVMLRNFDEEAKSVTLRAELIPRPDAEGYEGPPEGNHEDQVVPIEAGETIKIASIPLLSVSGIPRHKAEEYFDASVRILDVKRD